MLTGNEGFFPGAGHALMYRNIDYTLAVLGGMGLGPGVPEGSGIWGRVWEQAVRNPELFVAVGMLGGDVVEDITGIGLVQARRFVRHHTVPRQILQKYLPPEVANDPRVRGVRGSPNRWLIPRELHREIHRGPRGGPYNARWRAEINAIRASGREVTVSDVLRIRNQLIVEFELEDYRP